MKLCNILFAAAALLSAVSCGRGSTDIVVTNNLSLYRDGEMAEMEASEIKEKYPDGFVIRDKNGKEVPYQITYDGKLIFPVHIGRLAQEVYTVTEGVPSEVKPKVYGRVFPEHKDNMNWENDKAAYVAYGPALQAAGECGYGYDIWTKSVDTLVLEMRNKLELEGVSLHEDHGNGMDAYIVASTLGGGTAALLDDNGDIIYPWAWKEAEVLDNGPLRFTVRLKYASIVVENDSNVVETRLITLDAGSHLNRTNVRYEGLTSKRNVAAGIVVHKQNPHGYMLNSEFDFMSYRDFTDHPYGNNGYIYLGVLAACDTMIYKPIKEETRDAVGHILAIERYDEKEGFNYWWGSAWSGGSMPANWNVHLSLEMMKRKKPLDVKID